MREINTGNILPFYPSNTSTSNDVHYLVEPHSVGGNLNLIPFQINLQTSAGTPTFALFNEAGTFVTDLTPNIFGVPMVGDRTNYTHSANVVLPLQNCALYQIRIIYGGQIAFTSEWIEVKTSWDYRIEFRNNTDIGGVFYQNGYLQKVYFDGFEDRPQIDVNSENVILLNGREERTSYRRVERRVIVAQAILHSQLAAFHDLQIVRFKTIFVGQETIGVSINFLSVEDSGNVEDLNEVRLIFDSDIAAHTGCGENTYTIL